MKGLPMLAGWLLVLGGINLGLTGLLNYDLLGSVLGMGMISKVVNILVGLSAVYMAYNMLGAKKGKK